MPITKGHRAIIHCEVVKKKKERKDQDQDQEQNRTEQKRKEKGKKRRRNEATPHSAKPVLSGLAQRGVSEIEVRLPGKLLPPGALGAETRPVWISENWVGTNPSLQSMVSNAS